MINTTSSPSNAMMYEPWGQTCPSMLTVAGAGGDSGDGEAAAEHDGDEAVFGAGVAGAPPADPLQPFSDPGAAGGVAGAGGMRLGSAAVPRTQPGGPAAVPPPRLPLRSGGKVDNSRTGSDVMVTNPALLPTPKRLRRRTLAATV